MREVQKSLTERLLEHANVTFFEPRGLQVRLMRTSDMRLFVDIDSLDARPSVIVPKTSLQVIQDIPVISRIAGRIMGRARGGIARHVTEHLHRGSAFDPSLLHSNVQHRLAELQGYILPVSSDLPGPRTLDATIERQLATSEAPGPISANPDRRTAGNTIPHRQSGLSEMRRGIINDVAKAMGNYQSTGRLSSGSVGSKVDADVVWVVLCNIERAPTVENGSMSMQVTDTYIPCGNEQHS